MVQDAEIPNPRCGRIERVAALVLQAGVSTRHHFAAETTVWIPTRSATGLTAHPEVVAAGSQNRASNCAREDVIFL